MDIDREGISELIEETARRVASLAAAKTVEALVDSHQCKWFSEKQAKRVQAFDRACDEHDVTEGDIMVMVYSAKTAHGFIKDAGKRLFYTIVISAILVLAWLFGPETVRGWLGSK